MSRSQFEEPHPAHRGGKTEVTEPEPLPVRWYGVHRDVVRLQYKQGEAWVDVPTVSTPDPEPAKGPGAEIEKKE
jgi:hypothetical protein